MITAIISEFNPITNGHKYIIEKAKENGDFVLCIMSGNFVQRGEGAIFPKHIRAKMAVLCGADMVCELPVQFALSNAEVFAFGAIKLLSQIPSVGRIIFGSECGDIQKIKAQAEFCESDDLKTALAKNLAEGNTFAKAMSDALSAVGADFSTSPNDVLGVEYARAINKLGWDIQIETVARLGCSHDSEICEGDFASASLVRKLLKEGLCEQACKLVPSEVANILREQKIVDCSSFGLLSSFCGRFLQGRCEISEVSEGLENLLFQSDCGDFDSYAKKIKSKRYTLARIRRMCLKNILGITKADVALACQSIAFLKVIAVCESSVGIFSEDFGLTLIKRSGDFALLDDVQLDILQKMNDADDVFSMVCGERERMLRV